MRLLLILIYVLLYNKIKTEYGKSYFHRDFLITALVYLICGVSILLAGMFLPLLITVFFTLIAILLYIHYKISTVKKVIDELICLGHYRFSNLSILPVLDFTLILILLLGFPILLKGEVLIKSLFLVCFFLFITLELRQPVFTEKGIFLYNQKITWQSIQMVKFGNRKNKGFLKDNAWYLMVIEIDIITLGIHGKDRFQLKINAKDYETLKKTIKLNLSSEKIDDGLYTDPLDV